VMQRPVLRQRHESSLPWTPTVPYSSSAVKISTPSRLKTRSAACKFCCLLSPTKLLASALCCLSDPYIAVCSVVCSVRISSCVCTTYPCPKRIEAKHMTADKLCDHAYMVCLTLKTASKQRPEHQHVLHQISTPQNVSTMIGVLALDRDKFTALSVAQYGLVCLGVHMPDTS